MVTERPSNTDPEPPYMADAIALRIPDINGTNHWVTVFAQDAYKIAEAILERKAFYEKAIPVIQEAGIEIPKRRPYIGSEI